jgi:hypothetical protein
MKLKKIVFDLFILSAYVGIGISYSSFYLFHLLLIVQFLFFIYTLYYERSSIDKILNEKRFKVFNLLYLVTMIWFSLSFIWAENKFYNLQYLIIISLGYSISFFIIWNVNNQKDFHHLLKVLFFGFCIEIFVSILEITTPFRWPIARFSPISEWFGKPNDLEFVLQSSPDAPSYIETSPTGFSWNPNDLSLKISLFFPFILFSDKLNNFIKYILLLTIILIVVYSGSRLIYLDLIIISLLSIGVAFLSKKRNMIYQFVIIFLFLMSIMTNFFTFQKTGIKKIDELVALSRSLIGMQSFLTASSDHSGTTRKELILDGIKLLKDTHYIGAGGGNFKHYREVKRKIKDPYYMVNMHNHWLEILSEGGIFYWLFYVSFFIYILYKSLQLIFHSSIPSEIRYGIPLSLIMFIFGSAAPSSCIYFLPMYILIGVSLNYIFLYES